MEEEKRSLFLAAPPAPLIRHLVAERNVDQPQRLVRAGNAPAVRAAGTVCLPGSDGGGLVGVARVPVPQQLAGIDVIGADDPDGSLARTLSFTAPPMITRSRATTGGEVE